jgi:hypothetical protein
MVERIGHVVVDLGGERIASRAKGRRVRHLHVPNGEPAEGENRYQLHLQNSEDSWEIGNSRAGEVHFEEEAGAA